MAAVTHVEAHRRHNLSNRAFVLKVRQRICMPRNFFIRFTHKAAVTGWHAAEKPKQFTSIQQR